MMSKNGTQIHLRTKTQKNETLPKGIANRHLKVLDKCNIAINGKWLKDYLFLNLTKDKRPSAQNIKNPIECKGKKNIVQVKKQPVRITTQGKQNYNQNANLQQNIKYGFLHKRTYSKSINQSQQLPPHVIAYQNELNTHHRKLSCDLNGRRYKRKRLMSNCEVKNTEKQKQPIIQLNPWDFDKIDDQDDEIFMNL